MNNTNIFSYISMKIYDVGTTGQNGKSCSLFFFYENIQVLHFNNRASLFKALLD